MADKKLLETISIVIGIIAALVGVLAAAWPALKSAYSWMGFIGAVIIVGVLILLFIIIYLLVRKTKKGQAIWQTSKGLINFHNGISLILVIIFFAGGVLTQRYVSRVKTRNIQGTIYYEQTENKRGLDPVPDVTVSFANFKSEPTDKDGKFVLQDIPVIFQVTPIKATIGGQDYFVDYKQTENYALIPRPDPEPGFYRQVTTAWVEVPYDQCPTRNPTQFAIKNRFRLNAHLDPGAQRTFLTVMRGNQAKFEILNAFVLSPPDKSEHYRNETKEPDMSRWVFYLSKHGLNVQIEVCLGSHENSGEPWQQQLYTYEYR